jgi:electron transfer flavoprotein beta subunit
MAVNSIVCIKSVVRAAPNGVGRRTPENSELNPFDRPALEAALSIKEAEGGTVTVLSMGPEVAAEALAEARSMGADRAGLVNDPALAGSDTLATSRVLAEAVGRVGSCDFLFFGTRSSDSDTGQVGPQTATLLSVPFVGGVRRIGHKDGVWEFERLMDDWEELWEVRPPAALSIHPRAYPPRPIALRGIAGAFDPLEVETFTLADIGLEARSVGPAGSPTRVSRMEKVERRRKCRMMEGEAGAQVDALVDELGRLGLIEI